MALWAEEAGTGAVWGDADQAQRELVGGDRAVEVTRRGEA